jgi:acetylornithine aminotransferase
LPGEVTFVPYGDPDALAAAVTDRTAAVVLEPIQGEAGVVVPPAGYLAEAREIATRHGALLWLDEIQTGVGRTGSWFAHPQDVKPDLVTLAKGLAGGFPIGACVAFGESASLLQPGNHGTTFGGNPVAAAAALAVLRTIETEGLLDNAVKRGEQLAQGISQQVDGRGLLLGIVLDGPHASAVATVAQRAGFIVNAATADRVRLAPPLVLSELEAASFVEAWPAIVAEAKEHQSS